MWLLNQEGRRNILAWHLLRLLCLGLEDRLGVSAMHLNRRMALDIILSAATQLFPLIAQVACGSVLVDYLYSIHKVGLLNVIHSKNHQTLEGSLLSKLTGTNLKVAEDSYPSQNRNAQALEAQIYCFIYFMASVPSISQIIHPHRCPQSPRS